MDKFSREKRSEIMSKIRSKDTGLEKEFGRFLWSQGFRYRKNSKKYFGTPDFVFNKYQTVIFIDSCFWHGCKKHFKLPTTNVQFWREKIGRNMARDKEVNKYYKDVNWTILRIWEHELDYFYDQPMIGKKK